MWKQILIDFSSSFLNQPLEISHKVKSHFQSNYGHRAEHVQKYSGWKGSLHK